MKNFNKLCVPAKIYFAIAVIATIIALLNGVHMMYALCKIIFAFIWTFVLGFLCNKGYTSISWLLVLLPYILIALAMFNIYQVTEEERKFMRAIKLQGPYGREAFVEGFKMKGIKDNVGEKKSLGDIFDRAKKLSKEEYDELKLRRAEEEARRAEEEARRAQDEARRLEEEARQAEIARQEAEIASIEETVIVEEPNNQSMSADGAPSGSLSWWLGG